MHRLLVNPGSPHAWEICLRPGKNTIGRGPENDVTIEHDSISAIHCQIEVGGHSVRVSDLGSTNGTFIDAQPVQEAMLRAGQMLQLGSVTMALEISGEAHDELAAAVSKEPGANFATAQNPSLGLHHHPSRVPGVTTPLPSAVTTCLVPVEEEKPVFCKNHYQNLARFRCPNCSRYVCDLCVHTRGTAGGGQKFCKICGRECAPVAFKEVAERIDFFQEARRAFKYPVMGDGLVLLFGGSFFFGFLDLANYVSRHGFKFALRAMMLRVTIFTFIFGTGYLFAYLKKIITASADGDPTMPDWPEFSEWHADIVTPVFQFVVLAVICFGPALVLHVWSEGGYPWLVWPLVLAGCGYFPMGFLGIAMYDSLVALNPKFIVGSILRVPREYLVSVMVFVGIIAVRWLLATLLGQLLKIPLAPALIADMITIYLLLAESRILGVLYYSEKNVLGWFRRNR